MTGGDAQAPSRKRNPVTAVRNIALVAICTQVALAATVFAESRTLKEWLPQLKTGTWVKVEGRIDPAGGLRALEIKVYHGDRDEVEIATTVTAVNTDQRSFVTRFGIGVETNSRTDFEGSKKLRTSFSTLQIGDRIEAEGQMQKNGTLLADEIEIKKREKNKDDDDEITGRVESVDVGGHTAVVLGTRIFFDERTKNKSPFPE
jgi:Domain of unknown function (DUF5666)